MLGRMLSSVDAPHKPEHKKGQAAPPAPHSEVRSLPFVSAAQQLECLFQARPFADKKRKQEASKGLVNVMCFQCREKGHLAKDCPKRGKKASNQW